MILREFPGLQLYANVRITRRERGKLVAAPYENHNIVVNLGRNWLKTILCAGSYLEGAEEYPPAIPQDLEDYALDGGNFKMRYVALGVGGILQNHDPPGACAQTEIVTVKGLEIPMAVRWHVQGVDYQWMKQVLPQPLTDPLSHISDTAVRFRCVFGETDVSFAEQVGGYGTKVPVSEALLLTSGAWPYVCPCVGTVHEGFQGHGDGGVPGAVAYDIFEPQHKTPFMTMEIDWEILY